MRIYMYVTDVTAYVDVRSGSENRSLAIACELTRLGATVLDRFTEGVTHVVFKDGHKRTLNMARRREGRVKLVSVLWVERFVVLVTLDS